MAQAELVKIQDMISEIAAFEDGNLLLQLMEGPILAFFDERNFEDKVTLENHISASLEEISG